MDATKCLLVAWNFPVAGFSDGKVLPAWAFRNSPLMKSPVGRETFLPLISSVAVDMVTELLNCATSLREQRNSKQSCMMYEYLLGHEMAFVLRKRLLYSPRSTSVVDLLFVITPRSKE